MTYPEKLRFRAIELYQGCSTAQLLKTLEKEFPEQHMPDEREIRRWHNKKLLREHYERMAEMSESLVRGFGEVYQNQKRGNQFDTLEYSFWTDGYGYGVTREWLGSKLGAHIETVIEQCPDIDWESFLPHIIAEYPGVESIGLVRFATTNPYELLQTLKGMAEEKSFRGKCPVCEHLR